MSVLRVIIAYHALRVTYESENSVNLYQVTRHPGGHRVHPGGLSLATHGTANLDKNKKQEIQPNRTLALSVG